MEAYTGFAGVYDELMDETPYEQWSDNVVQALESFGIQDGLLLDLGCGTGTLTELLAAVADVGNTISHDDENYDFFTTTIPFSSQELYCEHMREELTFFMPLSKQSRPCDYLDEDGETVYGFSCFVDANVTYSINAPELVTVAERDKALLTFKEEMQNYLNGLSEEEIVGGDIKKMLTDKSTELANSLSTENMKLSPCDIYMIEIHNAGTEITK